MIENLLIDLQSPLTVLITGCTLIFVSCGALWFFAPAWLPVNHKHLAWAAGISLFIATFAWYWFHAGEDNMARKIAAKDAGAISRVNEAVKNVNACEAKGGTWDVTVGSCR